MFWTGNNQQDLEMRKRYVQKPSKVTQSESFDCCRLIPVRTSPARTRCMLRTLARLRTEDNVLADLVLGLTGGQQDLQRLIVQFSPIRYMHCVCRYR